MTSVQNVSSRDALLRSIHGERLVVVDFYSTNCPPCRSIAPKLDELAKNYDFVNFHKVNIDTLPKVANEFNIENIPTFHFYENGSQIHQIVGANLPAIKKVLAEWARKFQRS